MLQRRINVCRRPWPRPSSKAAGTGARRRRFPLPAHLRRGAHGRLSLTILCPARPTLRLAPAFLCLAPGCRSPQCARKGPPSIPTPRLPCSLCDLKLIIPVTIFRAVSNVAPPNPRTTSLTPSAPHCHQKGFHPILYPNPSNVPSRNKAVRRTCSTP